DDGGPGGSAWSGRTACSPGGYTIGGQGGERAVVALTRRACLCRQGGSFTVGSYGWRGDGDGRQPRGGGARAVGVGGAPAGRGDREDEWRAGGQLLCLRHDAAPFA